MDTNQTGIGGLEITTFKLTGCTYPEFIIANTDIDYWLQRQPGFPVAAHGPKTGRHYHRYAPLGHR